MSNQNFAFYNSFWDDSPNVSNGFDAVVAHVNQTFDMASRFIEAMSMRVEILDQTSKNIAKLARSTSKHDKFDKIFGYIADVWGTESTSFQHVSDEFTKSSIDKFHDTLKKQLEIMRKAKADTLNSFRNRKAQYDNCLKACKIYTSKYRLHDQMIKKCAGMEHDEKVSKKISSSLQGLKLSEKDVKVNIEMLNQNLEEYETSFMEFCSKVETLDKIIIESIELTLRDFYNLFSKTSTDVINSYTKFNAIPAESTQTSYIQRFVNDKGNTNSYQKYACLSESGEGERIEFHIYLSNNSADKSSTNKKIIRGNSLVSSQAPPPNEKQTNGTNIPTSTPTTSETGTPLVVRAIYGFEAQNSDELTFLKGENITVISKEDEYWYIGRLSNGKTGVFPMSYCEKI